MFLFYEMSYLNEEVNCNEEPSLLVRVPCKKIDPKSSIFYKLVCFINLWHIFSKEKTL
jgi:hypothetical protein